MLVAQVIGAGVAFHWIERNLNRYLMLIPRLNLTALSLHQVQLFNRRLLICISKYIFHLSKHTWCLTILLRWQFSIFTSLNKTISVSNRVGCKFVLPWIWNDFFYWNSMNRLTRYCYKWISLLDSSRLLTTFFAFTQKHSLVLFQARVNFSDDPRAQCQGTVTQCKTLTLFDHHGFQKAKPQP